MAFPHDGKKFKKGQSGNPTGENYRKSIDTIVREFLEKTTEAKINGKVQEVKRTHVRATPGERAEVPAGIERAGHFPMKEPTCPDPVKSPAIFAPANATPAFQ